jgi:acyl carrier protein
MIEEVPNSALPRLLGVPRSERYAALVELVSQEFKRALQMSEDEDLPLDDNYFDLGLTSLKAAEVKQRLEGELECELETAVLFSSATVRQLVDHLAPVVLPGPVSRAAPGVPNPDQATVFRQEPRRLVEDLLRDLYDN